MENQTHAQNQRVPVIQVSGLKKQYKLGQIGGGTLTHDLQSWWARVRGKEDPNTVIGTDARLFGKTFMALNGVDLTVYKGEALGIIGRNGAGKSTLLKILSRITAPTEGEIRLRGRVASMLEVGTGFNNEMTGRENIYMNGAILGMTRAEIDAKLPQIIEFSECGDFIDTPVKRYSSGMFVRLAFALAINVDPEILIVDEALSVGDVFFQSKCYRKFNDLKEAGKTILFVSHDMGSVIKYCERCLLINKGKQVMVGKSSEAVDVYKKILANQYDDETKEEEETEESAEQTEERTEADASGAVSAEKPKKGLWRERLIANAQLVEYGDKAAEIVDFAIIDHKGMITSSVDKNQRFRIKMKIKFHETMEHPIFAFSIKDRKGTEITGTNTALEDYTKDVVEAGKTVTVCFDQIMPLQSGQYLMSFGCTSYHLEELVIHHRLYDACFLEVFSMKDTVGFFDMNSTVTYE